jgi:hypothetical protein
MGTAEREGEMSTLQPISYPQDTLWIFFYTVSMKYKCLFCSNFARPTSYATCENLACYHQLKQYWWQKRTYRSVDEARKSVKQISKEIKFIEAKRKQLRAIKTFIKTDGRMSKRRFS